MQQFEEWMIFAELEPFDEEREDYRNALIAQVIAEVNRNPKVRRRPIKLEEARLRFGDAPAYKPPEMTWQQQKQMGLAIALANGAVIERAQPVEVAKAS